MNRCRNRQIEALDNIHQLKLIFNIQMIRRLIENHALRLLRERTREDDALLLPTRETAETPLLKPRHADRRERLPRNLVILRVVTVEEALVRGASHQHHADDGKVEAVNIVLRHDGEPERRRSIGKRIEQPPVESNLPRRRVLHTVQTFEKHTLAAAVRADNAEELLGP